jgi:hypothetical protein
MLTESGRKRTSKQDELDWYSTVATYQKIILNFSDQQIIE